MTTTAGSLESVSVRGRLFAVAADADAARKLGGFENEVASNGNGTARILKTRVPWSLTDVEVDTNDDRADQEFLQEIADGKDFVAVTFTLVSGVTYMGKAIITDSIEFSTAKGTAKLSFMGEGKATQQ
jgi:hypothetical protein